MIQQTAHHPSAVQKHQRAYQHSKLITDSTTQWFTRMLHKAHLVIAQNVIGGNLYQQTRHQQALVQPTTSKKQQMSKNNQSPTSQQDSLSHRAAARVFGSNLDC
jgi:hypothetical protein